jgi:hypothetical protein
MLRRICYGTYAMAPMLWPLCYGTYAMAPILWHLCNGTYAMAPKTKNEMYFQKVVHLYVVDFSRKWGIYPQKPC